MEIHIDDVVDDIEVVHRSEGHEFVEIWQGNDLVEFELKTVPALIEALQKVLENR